MTQREFHDWCDFYRLFPFDDYHRHHRPAALVSVSMGGGDVSERLEWLSPEYAEKTHDLSGAFGIPMR